jgi:hypothetical protein
VQVFERKTRLRVMHDAALNPVYSKEHENKTPEQHHSFTLSFPPKVQTEVL